jgi:4'-phosphopantetheinyl transferase
LAIGVLSAAERSRADRYRFEEDRQRYIAGRATLRRILFERTGIPADQLVIEEADWKKPRLVPSPEAPRVYFNVSHSGDYALIAYSDSMEVGVDIEQIRADCPIDDLARRYYAARELEAFRKLPPPRRLLHFYRLWTIKEAVLKCAGLGLSVPPNVLQVRLNATGIPSMTCMDVAHKSVAGLFVRELTLAEGYVSAVAAESEYTEIEIVNSK